MYKSQSQGLPLWCMSSVTKSKNPVWGSAGEWPIHRRLDGFSSQWFSPLS